MRPLLPTGGHHRVSLTLPDHLAAWHLPPGWSWGSEGVWEDHRHFQEIVDALGRSLSLVSAPLPEHVMELIHRGRLADGNRLMATLGITPQVTTREVIDRLFRWESIVRVPSSQAA